MSDFKLPVGHQKLPTLVFKIMVKAIVHKCHLDTHNRTFAIVLDSENYGKFCSYLHNVFTTVGLAAINSEDTGKGYYFLRLDNGCTFRVYDDSHFNVNLLRGMTASFMFARPLTEDESSCLYPVVASSPSSFLLEVH
ncbi:hypothetical protein MYOV003v1_p0017 [Vibrio phage 207E48.1]|nr:hypothetical protein MYOV003v1_p0017 [Vibrio phage 207E48.1]